MVRIIWEKGDIFAHEDTVGVLQYGMAVNESRGVVFTQLSDGTYTSEAADIPEDALPVTAKNEENVPEVVRMCVRAIINALFIAAEYHGPTLRQS